MQFVRIETELQKVGARGPRYAVYHDGECIIEGSTDPSSDAARELVSRGFDLDSTLLVYEKGDINLRMHGRLGLFASMRVSEGQSFGPRFVLWQPYSGPGRDLEDEIDIE